MEYNRIEMINSLLPQEQKIKIKKLLQEARFSSRPEKCPICGCTISHHCKSHSIPKFILENIKDENGKVIPLNYFLNIDYLKTKQGVKSEAGIFHQICSACDNSFFQDYESEEALKKRPTQKALAEIAVKNFLLYIEKYKTELAMAEDWPKFDDEPLTESESYWFYKALDTNFMIDELSVHIRNANQGKGNHYSLMFFRRLPYKIPIAFQGGFTPEEDFKGNKLNDVSLNNITESMKYIHIVAFPLKSESIIFMFYHKKDVIFRDFRKQLMQSTSKEVLKYINYLIISSSEHFYIAPSTAEKLKENEAFVKLAAETNGKASFFEGFVHPFYQPVNINDVPNLLSKEWALPSQK